MSEKFWINNDPTYEGKVATSLTKIFSIYLWQRQWEGIIFLSGVNNVFFIIINRKESQYVRIFGFFEEEDFEIKLSKKYIEEKTKGGLTKHIKLLTKEYISGKLRFI